MFGLKPSFGRVPAYPPSPFSTLAHVGPMSRTVADAALMLNVIAEPDARDWFALPFEPCDYRAGLDDGVAGLKVAFSPALGYAEVDAEVADLVAQAARVFENLGGGQVRNISIDEEVAEADAVATDVESNDSGIIYAYSFPSIRRNDGRFPIKVGLTTTGDAEARVTRQCKQTCCFEYPVVLKTWEVQRVAAVEDAIHSTLDARGSKRQAPGTEWFDTTLEEIETIVKFVQPPA